MPWLLVVGLLVITGLFNLPSARAQSAARVILSAPETGSFPQISSYLSVYDSLGNFVHDLTPADLRVLEDEFERLVDEMNEEQVGVQFAVALAPGPAFEIRDIQGNSRYQNLLPLLLNWDLATAQRGLDAYSLATPLASSPLRTTDPAQLLQAIQDYQPMGEQETPDLQPLVSAMDTVAEQPLQSGMGRAVLFITAPLDEAVGLSLQNLAARANQQNIRIYVLLIGPAYLFSEVSIAPLQSLAEQSGGQFWGYSGTEAVPSLGALIEPLRYRYRFTYASQVARAGEHQLSVRVTLDGEQVTSTTQTFSIDLQAPSASFILPPSTIPRTFVTDPAEAPEENAPALSPAEQGFTIAIDFPDGYPRSLVRSTLYVDGIVADENTAEPFNQFTWDLSPYASNETHTLQTEVVDNLGLSSLSAEISVQIEVPPPEEGVVAAFARQRGLVIGLVVLICGAVLVLVLVLGGRIQPRHPASGPASRRKKRQAASRAADPVTQPVEISPEGRTDPPRSRPAWMEHLHWPERSTAAHPAAYLTPLPEADCVTLPSPYPISTEQLTLGRDPAQAALVLEDPSVDPLHARLERRPEGFWLIDAGSVAGVWVNYQPVAGQGAALQHGDLVHIGSYGFRFTLRDPGRQNKPTAVLQEASH